MTELGAGIMVALGGGLGALGRWAISLWISPVPLPTSPRQSAYKREPQGPQFPLPTFVANLSACALLGLAVRLADTDTSLYVFLVVGVCGGLSTYSTFAVEVGSLLREHGRWVALGYLVSTLVGGLLVFLATAA